MATIGLALLPLLWPALASIALSLLTWGILEARKTLAEHARTVPLSDVADIAGQALEAAVKAAGAAGPTPAAIKAAEQAAFNLIAAQRGQLEADALAELHALVSHAVALKAGAPISLPSGVVANAPAPREGFALVPVLGLLSGVTLLSGCEMALGAIALGLLIAYGIAEATEHAETWHEWKLRWSVGRRGGLPTGEKVAERGSVLLPLMLLFSATPLLGWVLSAACGAFVVLALGFVAAIALDAWRHRGWPRRPTPLVALALCVGLAAPARAAPPAYSASLLGSALRFPWSGSAPVQVAPGIGAQLSWDPPLRVTLPVLGDVPLFSLGGAAVGSLSSADPAAPFALSVGPVVQVCHALGVGLLVDLAAGGGTDRPTGLVTGRVGLPNVSGLLWYSVQLGAAAEATIAPSATAAAAVAIPAVPAPTAAAKAAGAGAPPACRSKPAAISARSPTSSRAIYRAAMMEVPVVATCIAATRARGPTAQSRAGTTTATTNRTRTMDSE